MFRHLPYLHPGRSVPRLIAAAAAIDVLLITAPLCLGQRPTSTPVATDRPALSTSSRFGPINSFTLSDSENVFFASGGATALFRWNPAAGAPARRLQTNDPIETLRLPKVVQDQIPPGSLLDLIGGFLHSNGAYTAFSASMAIKGETAPVAPVVFAGNSYRLVRNFPKHLSQLFVNASGKLAAAGLANPFPPAPTQIYLEKPSGEAVKVAETQTPAPDAVGGSYSSLRLLGFNNAGQAAFLADIVMGSSPRALFLADGTNVNLVVKTGDPVPGAPSCTFNLPPVGNHRLNNSGEIAFESAIDCPGATRGIWIGRVAAPPESVVRAGEPAGIPGWGNHLEPLTLRGFNDSGQVLFDSNLSTAPGWALFLKDLAPAATQVVVYRGQAAGAAGNIDYVRGAVLNNAGKAALQCDLTGGSSPLGWYLGSGTEAPIKIAAEGDGTPLGGVFGLSRFRGGPPAQLNAAGRVLFVADILGLNETGLFLWNGGTMRTVVSTRDPLPSGAHTVLRMATPAASDAGVLLRVWKAGGQATWYAQHLKTGMNRLRKIVTEFDVVPGAGTIVAPGSFSMNNKGEVAFLAGLLRPDKYPHGAVLGMLPGGGLEPVVSLGDPAPGGGDFSAFSSLVLNNLTQVAFYASTTVGPGIFIARRNPPGLEAVVRPGVPWPGGGGALNSFATSVALNDSGQVAFQANRSGASPPSGLFIGTGGGAPVKVVATGDILPAGTVTRVPAGAWKLNASGHLAFVASLTTGQGVFLGAGGGTPQAVALTGAPAPGAGSATFGEFRDESIDLDDLGRVAFWAALYNAVPTPNAIGSGWFLGSATAAPAPRLLQDQVLPGGGKAGKLTPGSRFAALAGTGEMAMFVTDVSGGVQPHMVIAGTNGVLRKFAVSGERAEGTGSDFGKFSPALLATPSGRFLFGAMLVNGPAQAGVFVNTQ